MINRQLGSQENYANALSSSNNSQFTPWTEQHTPF